MKEWDESRLDHTLVNLDRRVHRDREGYDGRDEDHQSGQQICDEFQRCTFPTLGSDCINDSACPEGAECVKGYCRICELEAVDQCATCVPGTDCPSGNQCDYQSQVCVECNEDDECVGDDILCQFGSCIAACFFDVDCPAGSTCNGATNRCEL